MKNQIKVSISDYKIGKSLDHLITLGLGSCVVIAIYDEMSKVGGLSHIMLPDGTQFKKNVKIQKFADLVVPYMVEDIRRKARFSKLGAKIAGGASMFGFPDSDPNESIGYRNVLAVEKILAELNIPILGSN